MGGFTDFFKGKEKTYKRDGLADGINDAGKSGLGMLTSGANALNEKIYQKPEGYIDNQIGMENNLLRTASQDATNRTRQLIAQRGIGNSSIGLGQQVNQERDLNQKLAMNSASGMERLRGLLNDQMQTGNQLMAPKMAQGPVQMADVKKRSGGMAALVGAGLGYAAGGSAGAQIGAGIGQSYQNS